MSKVYRLIGRCGLMGAIALIALGAFSGERAAERAGEGIMLDIALPSETSGPFVALTGEELARLRDAYVSSGALREVVAGRVEDAEWLIREPLVFPPRGGQHNQWYQCTQCESALETIDDTNHRCERCGTVYTGHPYDDVIFARVHQRNLRRAHSAAIAYAITGRQIFAEAAREVLVGYAKRYRQYPYHTAAGELEADERRTGGGRLFEQTLNEAASITTRIGPAYDLVRGSDVFSEEERKAVREGLIRPMLENIARSQRGISNWQSWHNAAMLWGGALLGEKEWIERAITDEDHGFLFQMQNSVRDEGMWYENSWGYHFYTLGALTETAEAARRLGIDLWGHETFQKMFTLPAHYVMPGGDLPRFGNDPGTSIQSGSRLFEYAWAAFSPQSVAPYLSRRPTFESVKLGRDVQPPAAPAEAESAIFTGAGHAILRTSGEAGLAAAFTFGPYGGFHGHFDKLSFVFYGWGEELAVGPGRARSQAYRLPVHTLWYKATISHNTVLVDGASQQAAEGRLLFFEAGALAVAAEAACDSAYSGVEHRRLLVLFEDYLLVVDDLNAGGQHRCFDWMYHNRAESVHCDGLSAGDLSGRLEGGEYIANTRFLKTDSPPRVSFQNERITTHVNVDPQGSTIWTGDGPGESVSDRVPLMVVTREGSSARFAAAVEPVRAGAAARVRGVSMDETGTGIVINVERTDGSDVVRRSADAIEVRRDGAVLIAGKLDN